MPVEPGAAPQRHILCMKWGTKYGPEYVNRLYAMVRRHLSGDFNFVCLTDDSQGHPQRGAVLSDPAAGSANSSRARSTAPGRS